MCISSLIICACTPGVDLINVIIVSTLGAIVMYELDHTTQVHALNFATNLDSDMQGVNIEVSFFKLLQSLFWL